MICANPRSDVSRVSDTDSTCQSDSMDWHNQHTDQSIPSGIIKDPTKAELEDEEIDVVGDSDPLDGYGKICLIKKKNFKKS